MNAAALTSSSRLRRLGAVVLSTLALACKVPTTSPEPGTAAPTDAPDTTTSASTARPVIDPARMLADVEYLSHDDLRGRYTFSEDLGVAADYIAAQYTAAGIEAVGGSYRVPFEAPAGSEPSEELTVWVEDDEGHSRQVSGKELTTLCTGKGKAAYAEVLVLAALGRAKARAVDGKVVIAPAPPLERRNEAITAFAKLGATGLVLVGERPPPNGEQSRTALAELSLPVVWLDHEAAQEWIGVETSAKGVLRPPGAIKLSMVAKREVVKKEAFNVLAVLPGREHPEQIVMLGAHYDHIGTSATGLMCREHDGDGVCNGADDNASGTAMVLEVARSYVEAGYRPARSLVFAHFAAEELGLHGSRALARRPPDAAPFSDGEVVAMINLDMVGRLGDEGLAVGGLSSSDAWMPLLESVEPEGLLIVYERAINGRSDHANFYREKIPVLFFFTGLHDDYHKPGDHFDKLNREGMAVIGQMVADLTRALADGADLPYTAPRNDDEGVVSRLPGSKKATVERRTKPERTRSKAR